MDPRAPLAAAILHGHDTVTLTQALDLLALAGDLRAGRAPAPATPASGLAPARIVALLRRASANHEIAGNLAAALGVPASIEQALRQPHPPETTALEHADALPAAFLPASASLTLVADTIELPLPWLAGHARRVARLAQEAARDGALDEPGQRCLTRAALLHGIGRAAIPASIWKRPARFGLAEREATRRAPFWTARAASHVDGLDQELQLAAQVYERLDGSGYYRGLTGADLTLAQRLLAVCAMVVALRSPRSWRPAQSAGATLALLEAQVAGGRLERAALRAVLDAARRLEAVPTGTAPASHGLSPRELDVLRRISQGQDPHHIARALRLSSAAVRRHIDSVYRQLGCSTRAAATLQALTLGLV